MPKMPARLSALARLVKNIGLHLKDLEMISARTDAGWSEIAVPKDPWKDR